MKHSQKPSRCFNKFNRCPTKQWMLNMLCFGHIASIRTLFQPRLATHRPDTLHFQWQVTHDKKSTDYQFTRVPWVNVESSILCSNREHPIILLSSPIGVCIWILQMGLTYSQVRWWVSMISLNDAQPKTISIFHKLNRLFKGVAVFREHDSTTPFFKDNRHAHTTEII